MNIEFEIEGKSYQIPTIRIRDYYAMRTQTMLHGKEAEFEIVSQLTGCDPKILRAIKLDQWQSLSFHINLLIDKELHLQPELVNQFKHDGVEYGLTDFDKMTIGEFADLDIIVNAENVDGRLHEMLAVLYRPIVKKKWKKNIVEDYDYDGYKHRCEVFLDLPVSMARAVSGFFLHIGKASLNPTPDFSNPLLNQAMQKVKQIVSLLQDNGISPSSDSLEKAYLISQELKNLELEKHLISSPGNTTNLKNNNSKTKKWFKNIIV